MVHLSGQFDPVSGLVLSSALQARLEAIFHGQHPPDTPDDSLEKQDFLRAHALLSLIAGEGRGSGAPEFVIVIDEETFLNGRHGRSQVDCGRGIDLPVDAIVLRRHEPVRQGRWGLLGETDNGAAPAHGPTTISPAATVVVDREPRTTGDVCATSTRCCSYRRFGCHSSVAGATARPAATAPA